MRRAASRDYVERYQGIYENLFPQMQRRVDWAGEVWTRSSASAASICRPTSLQERQMWRDRRLMALAAHKQRAAKEIGE